MATYPTSLATFSQHHDGDLVLDTDENLIQAEVSAIETALGVNPHISTTPNPTGTFQATSQTYASASARIANAETGVVSAAHSQYVSKAGGSVIAPTPGVVGLSLTKPATGSAKTFAVTDSISVPKVFTDSSLVLQSAFNSGTPVDITGTANAQGSSSLLATVDHIHRGGVGTGYTPASYPPSPYVGQVIEDASTNAIRVWNGDEWHCVEKNAVTYQAIPPHAITSNNTGVWESLPLGFQFGTYNNFPFTKNNNDWTTIRFVITAAGYSVTVPSVVDWSVSIYDSHGFYLTNILVATANPNAGQRTYTMGATEVSIAADTFTIYPMWRHSAGTATIDASQYYSITVDEV